MVPIVKYHFNQKKIDLYIAENVSKITDQHQEIETDLVVEDLVEETMKLAQRIALQDPFALRLSKASVNQLQDQMGYRNSIISGFHNHALGLSHRREMYEGERITSKERAAKRDERFGDRN